MKEDIYSRSKTLRNSLERIRNSEDIIDENKLLILKFHSQCFAEGLSTARIVKYLYTLQQISKMLNKPFEKANREDMVKLVEKMERNDKWSDWTKQHYKVTLKKFYSWLRKTDDSYPEEVSWIRTSMKNNSKLPEEILTEEEIKRLAEAASNPRDRALVLAFYESGCRVGELLTLKMKQISFDDHGEILFVRGKTGDRRVRIIASAPALSSWLENHPDRENPEAYVWLSLATNCKYEPLNYRGLYEIFKDLAKKAGIKKHVHPHLFRHSRATYLASKLTEQQLKVLFGWTQASKMASIYVHLSGRDVDNTLLALHGLSNSEKQDEKLKLKICPRCDEKNSPDAKYCKRCALTLDVETMEWENKMLDKVISKANVERYLRRALREVLIRKR
ncbi:MAG: tyrosine-type recombinase/integrase [Nitrososphaerales archaeon]